MLASALQQHESVIVKNIYMYISFLTSLPPPPNPAAPRAPVTVHQTETQLTVDGPIRNTNPVPNKK